MNLSYILILGNMTATLPSPLLPSTLFCATRKQHASNEQGLHVEISGQQYEMRRHLPKNGKMSIRCCCWDQTLGKTIKKKHPCLKRQFMKPVGHEGETKILAIYIISQWLPSLLWVPIAIPRQLASINQLHRLHLSSTKPQPSPLNDNKMMMTKLWWQNPWSNNPNKQKNHTKLNTKTHPMQQKLHLPTANRSHLHFQLFSSMLDFFGQCLLSNTKRPAKAQQWPVPKEAGGRSGPCENPFTAVGCVSKSSSIRCVESGETPLDPNDPWKNEGFTPPSYGL